MIFILPFICAFVLSVLFVLIGIKFAKQWGLVDDPKKHVHPAIMHKRVVPRAGGLAIYLACLVSAFLILPFDKKFVGIFLGGLVLVIVGILDDKVDLKSYFKLLSQILAALFVIGAGVGIAFITNPLGGVIRLDTVRLTFDLLGNSHSILVFADLFALFWIVWVINMVNFSSGVDGQMPGIVFVALLVIFASTLRFVVADPSQVVVGQLALIGAGATLGFLLFNFYPAKIFPGDSGSYFLGYLVAVVAILSGAKVGTAILVMAVPLIDGVFTVIRRIASGKSPFVGDRKHLHHRLIELGWGHARIALFYWLLCAILGATALLLPTSGKLFAGMVAAVVILGGLLLLNINLPQKDQS